MGGKLVLVRGWFVQKAMLVLGVVLGEYHDSFRSICNAKIGSLQMDLVC